MKARTGYRSTKGTRWGRLKLLAAGMTLLVALFFVACGGDSSSRARSDDMAPPEQQVLRLRLGSDPRTIDPHLASTATDTTVVKPLFAGLFTYDQNLNVVPNLARGVPSSENGGISRDGLTYTIDLRKDAKWSDGKPVTANDFVYSLQRALDPKLASPYASFLYSIEGAREYNTALGTANAPKNPSDAELAALRDRLGVHANDDYTLVYRLREPDPSFLNRLALWTAYPVRKDVVEQHGARWTEPANFVGNGPFKLARWDREQRLVLEPNPYWFGEKVALTRLELIIIADEAAAYAAYLADELDVAPVPAAARREVSSPGSPLHPQFRRVNELATFALWMNGAAAPFDNMKVRQAIGMAIDRNALVEGVLQGAGRATTTWIAPGQPGHNPELGKQYEFNPAKAKQLLAEAGYPDGQGLPRITFLWVANDANRLQGQFIEDQLRRNLGIEVTSEYVDSRTYGSRFGEKQYQVLVQRWIADWPYPDNWLPELFRTGATNNRVAYSNPRFDDLVASAARELNDKKRLELYDKAQKLILDEAAVIPLYNRDQHILVKPWVRDLVVTPLDGAIKGDYHFARVYIAAR